MLQACVLLFSQPKGNAIAAASPWTGLQRATSFVGRTNGNVTEKAPATGYSVGLMSRFIIGPFFVTFTVLLFLFKALIFSHRS